VERELDSRRLPRCPQPGLPGHRQDPRPAHRRRLRRLRPGPGHGAQRRAAHLDTQLRPRVQPPPSLLRAADLSDPAADGPTGQGHPRPARPGHPATPHPHRRAALFDHRDRHAAAEHRRPARGQPDHLRRVPDRQPPDGAQPDPADQSTRRRLPGLQPRPALAWPGGPRPAGVRGPQQTHRDRPPLLPRRSRRVGLGRTPARAAAVPHRHPVSTGPCRGRCHPTSTAT